VRFNLIGLAEPDVDAPAIGLPSGGAAGVMLVGVSDTRVMLFAVFIGVGVRVGVAAVPEAFDSKNRCSIKSLLPGPPDAVIPLGFVWDVFVRTRAMRSLARSPTIFSHSTYQKFASAPTSGSAQVFNP
jgi:hypothetical protein